MCKAITFEADFFKLIFFDFILTKVFHYDESRPTNKQKLSNRCCYCLHSSSIELGYILGLKGEQYR